MSSSVSAISRTYVRGLAPNVCQRADYRVRFGNWALFGFLITQCLDGLFTYIGIGLYGPSIEGNPLLTGLMHELGHVPALAVAKICAAALGVALHALQVYGAVALLTAFYLLAAILPWSIILFW